MLIALAVCFSIVLLSLRYWLLPNVDQYREDIASAISSAAGQRVTIGDISANWDGLRPHMLLRAVQVHDKEGDIMLLLHSLEGTLSWRSLLHGELNFREIAIEQPDLAIRRDVQGVIHVAGFALDKELTGSENGFADWLLNQRRVTIRNGSILWQDDHRGAPELELLVNLRLENHGNRHRFGVRAIPPAKLAARLDIRGDFTGASLNIPEQWRGLLFMEMAHADVAAWRIWLPLPDEMRAMELHRGFGALRMWAGMDGVDLKKLTADMRLTDVRARLAPELPELNLGQVTGRIGWQKTGSGTKDGTEIFARNLLASVRGARDLPPTSFRLQFVPARGGKPAGGKLSVDRLKLEVMDDLINYLPVSTSLREQLDKASPRGEIHSLRAQWSGEWPELSSFGVKGRFIDLGTRKWKFLPAFRGMSGNLDITQRGGALNLNAHNAVLIHPDMFQEPLALDTLTGQVSWTIASSEDAIAFKFSNVSFSNPDGAGMAYGNYHVAADGKDEIDLTGHVTRAEAARVMRYIPIAAVRAFPEWLKQSIAGGNVLDARLHLKGDLAKFPFGDDSQGIFKLQVKAAGVMMNGIPGWPRIEDAAGTLQFNGSLMEIDATRGIILDTQLNRAKIGIADMSAPDATLKSEIEASGDTMQFLKFAATSTADLHDDDLIDKIQVQGNGKLSLRFYVPLQHPEAMRLSGDYQFTDNLIDPGIRIPSLSQINGRLTFNRAGIKTANATGRFLGGPVAISSVESPEGTRLTATGKINLDNLAEAPQVGTRNPAQGWTRYLRGSADWEASLHRHNGVTDLTVRSPLRGITSDLPEPFSKIASEAVPLRFERKAANSGRDDLSLDYGAQVAARIGRIRENDGHYRPREGFVNLGATVASTVPAAEKKGISVNVDLPQLDLDRWDRLLDQLGSDDHVDLPGMTSLRFKVDALDLRGRRFNNITLKADREDDWWYSSVTGDEISGGISLNLAGDGKIVARLNRLIIPVAAPGRDSAAQPRQGKRNLPALDITADSLIVGEKELGRLELIANQNQRNWHVEKLQISNADSSITGQGTWRNGMRPRVRGSVKLRSEDIGKLLTRLGHPERVTRGSGELGGEFTWQGSPESINYPTLSGAFQLNARRGQFPKFEPGIGRLFGIFNLRSLPRRISLDFHDVFSEGFGFDDIAGEIKITRGVATIDGLRIEGPSAKVVMNGEMNLDAETQKLHIKVTPSFGLATPVVGMASVIARPALRNPPITPNEYDITGTWADPVVNKISAQPQEAARRD